MFLRIICSHVFTFYSIGLLGKVQSKELVETDPCPGSGRFVTCVNNITTGYHVKNNYHCPLAIARNRKPDYVDINYQKKFTYLNSMYNIDFTTIDWSKTEKKEYPGITGKAFWRTMLMDGLRIRIVDYSENYMADHWCQKGHIVHCLEGEFTSEMENGESVVLKKGMTYVVSDDLSSHRSLTKNGAQLLIVDGDFLKLP